MTMPVFIVSHKIENPALPSDHMLILQEERSKQVQAFESSSFSSNNRQLQLEHTMFRKRDLEDVASVDDNDPERPSKLSRIEMGAAPSLEQPPKDLSEADVGISSPMRKKSASAAEAKLSEPSSSAKASLGMMGDNLNATSIGGSPSIGMFCFCSCLRVCA